MPRPGLQHFCGLFRGISFIPFADKLNAAGQVFPIDDNLDPISIPQFADGPACERFGPDMTDTSACGYAGESRNRDNGDMLSPGDVFQYP
jgi:hypothetical protein